ncbi:VWA domain-containing protein [Streptomyces werraensis]|uniref:VWA domain-containing protein n=1 Tax=Streptomyces werraensis TaxID=68284 RepID=UPI00341627C6
MGILTLLRNAFGRSRKARSTEAEGAAPAAEATETTAPTTPDPSATATVPEQRESDEHDLVRSAFDKVEVPRPARSSETEATTPEPDPTPASPEPTPTPEAEAAPAAPEPEAESEPTPTTPEPEAAAEPEAEASAGAKPETKSEPKAEAEPEAAAEPEAKADPAPEATPAAADGEQAPLGPPAPDDETRTGGAGGNESPAEGEAEADAKPEPETGAKPEPEAPADPSPEATPAPDDETRTGGAGGNESPAEGEAEAEAKPEPETGAKPEPEAPAAPAPEATPAPDDETRTGGAGGDENPAEGEAEAETTPAPGKPATPASALRNTTLTTAYKAAGTVLGNNDLTGARAKVHLVLDRSASMRPYYKDGSAQALAEQTLALAAHLDPEATLHVTFFSTELDGTGELTLTDHENKIDELHAGLGRMGRTSYHAAVEAVLEQHAKEPAGTPALVIFQTDGAPDAKTPATKALTDAAKNHPDVFFSFVAFGEHDNKAFDYLRKLKTDNASFFHAGPTPRELTDKELYEGVLANWRP